MWRDWFWTLMNDFKIFWELNIRRGIRIWINTLIWKDSTSKLDTIEDLLDLKKNKKLLNYVNKECINGYLNIIYIYTNVFDINEPFITSFFTTWLVVAVVSVGLNVFSNRNSALNINKEGSIRIKLNSSIVINYDELWASHQKQKSH